MLDVFIIEQLRKREERERNQAEHGNRLELPLEAPREAPSAEHRRAPTSESESESDLDRGVVVFDL